MNAGLYTKPLYREYFTLIAGLCFVKTHQCRKKGDNLFILFIYSLFNVDNTVKKTLFTNYLAIENC